MNADEFINIEWNDNCERLLTIDGTNETKETEDNKDEDIPPKIR